MITMTQLEKIVIRKAVASDLPTMLQMMYETLQIPISENEVEEQLQSWMIKLNDHSRVIFYVAETDGENLVGFCRGGRTIESHNIVNNQVYDCEIHNIFIRVQYQRHGIGRKLWKIMWNDILLSFQPKNFVVWAVDKEQAHAFYLSLGGVPQEKRNLYDDCISTAFVWNNLKLFEVSNA